MFDSCTIIMTVAAISLCSNLEYDDIMNLNH
jgi:hypothetical protein